jgi:hypothetical protein
VAARDTMARGILYSHRVTRPALGEAAFAAAWVAGRALSLEDAIRSALEEMHTGTPTA